MTAKAFPFAGVGVPDEASWDLMMRWAQASGVIRKRLNAFEVFADSTGMQIKVKSGEAMIDGKFFREDAQQTIAVTAADGSNPRIDYVVAELDRSAHTITLKVIAGTPAGSPVAPSLTQNETGTWQLPLAQVRVDAGVSTIAANKVTDVRMYAGRQSKQVVGVTSDTNNSTTLVLIDDMTTTLWTRGGDIDVEFSGEISIAPAGGGGNYARVQLAVDGTPALLGTVAPSTTNFPIPISGKIRFIGLSAGLHTITALWQTNSSGVTATIGAWRYLTATEALD